MLMQAPPPTATASPSTMNVSQQSPQMLQSPVYKAQMENMYHPNLGSGMAKSMPQLSQNPMQPMQQQMQQPMNPQMAAQALQGGGMLHV